jgi:RTX calcium-binding nonapeptide repeat (4 copies)/WD40-like Beta Propeller Repeat
MGRSRALVTIAALSGAVLVLLPLGGASAATSSGADGDIAFVNGLNTLLTSTGSTVVPGAIDPSWSPDGKKLAVSVGGATVQTCTVTAGSCGPLSGALDTGTEPVWSPDGTKIAYVNGGQVWTMTSIGGSKTQLTSGGGTDPSWSPTATGMIAFALGGSIYTIGATSPGSGTPLSITGSFTAGTLSRPAWSPDGSQIAFQASDGTNTQIWTVPSAGGTATQVTDNSVVSGNKTAPEWAPTSDALVYSVTGTGIYTSTQGVGGSWGIPQQHHAGTDTTPDWQTVAPVAVTAPSINGGGSPQTGQLLSTTTGSWIGASSVFTYQWSRCDSAGNNCSAIGGATASTYAVLSADVGHTLRSAVTAVNAAGSTASSPSTQTGVVTVAGTVNPPVNTAYPVITLPVGRTTPNIGDYLFASTGTWTGSFPITYTYQWKKCDSPTGSCYRIPGATFSYFLVTPDLYGMSIRVEVTATNSAAAVAQNSASTGVVGAIAPFLRVTPQISGSVMVGQTLALTPGTWDGSLPLTYTYSWRRCDAFGTLPSCVEIATTATYIPVVADIGMTLRVWITATNPAGSDQGVTNHTFPVVDKPHFAPSASDSPLIVGTLEVGGVLTASIGSFTGDLPIATKQQWQRCDATGSACHDIKGATRQVYHPTSTDVGSTLRLVVTATNLYGQAVSISDVTEPVIPRLPHFKGKTITGTSKNDYLIGTIHDDLIKGLGGNDTINGDGGYDTIYGGSGNDVINVAGPGTSHVYGGPGSDTIYAANGEKDYIDCGPGQDRAVIDPFDVVHNCEVVQVGSSSGN